MTEKQQVSLNQTLQFEVERLDQYFIVISKQIFYLLSKIFCHLFILLFYLLSKHFYLLKK